ncbi:YpiB family protein [Macrococcus equi]|uniref:YpiB family protein n=1 Tax=Macrococcus equi TaxID=3395462 RepID=UPI0039BE3E3A
MVASIIEARSNFVKSLLYRYDIQDKNTVWLLNLIKDKEEILKRLQFRKTTNLSDQLIIFKNFKVHLILKHGIYTDSDVIFHYLLNNGTNLFVNIMFDDFKYEELCQQEIMHLLEFIFIEDEKLNFQYIASQIDIYFIKSQPKLFNHLLQNIDNAIEIALITKNELRFLLLVKLKNDLIEEKNDVI